jgi:hypothetical protein
MLSERDLAGIRATLADALPDGSTRNVTILELRGPGTVDGYGEVDDNETGSVQWTGEVGGHLRRSREFGTGNRTTDVTSTGGTVVEADEIAILRAELPESVLTQAGGEGVGWTVLFDDLRTGSAVRRRARVSGVVTEGDGFLADKVVLQLEEEQDG